MQRLFEQKFSPNDSDALHKKASRWFSEKGLIDEALYHALAAGDIPAAEQLLAQHRHDLMNREQWHQLDRWLRLFPAERVEKQTELLLSRAWLIYFYWYSLEALAHDLDLAEPLLQRLYDLQVRTHNTNWLIDILALQALLHDFQGDETAAFEKLTESLALAEPGGFIRPFLDLGPKMAGLLNRLAKRKTNVTYVGKLLTAFRNEKNVDRLPATPGAHSEAPDSVSPPDVVETMTKRELEITALLVQRLSNKEITDKLYISPETVKRHVYNIYQKLNVSTRREAANKAAALGILKG